MAEPPDVGLYFADSLFGAGGSFTSGNKSRETIKQMEDSKVLKKDKNPNPFNMTSRNFPKKRNHVRSTMVSYNRTRGSTFSANKALELVRAALQPSLNAEIEAILKSYQEMFKMAAHNIKDNTGEAVTEEQVRSVLRKSLDEAKLLFRSDCRVTSEKMRYERGASPVVVKRKRPRIDPDKEGSSLPVKSSRSDLKLVAHDWDPDSINEDTEFIMGVKANKALGFAATRGKLYYRHPELFKYSGDADDKQWLYEQNLLPITGGKAFLMISSDIKKLATYAEYKDNENIRTDELKGFKVPKAMVDKMKNYMRRSRKEAAMTVSISETQIKKENSKEGEDAKVKEEPVDKETIKDTKKEKQEDAVQT